MADQSTQQRLAAVLAADVVGYTRLMEKDAEGTVSAWQAARDDIITPTISDYSGRIVKLTGDGFLAEFPTAHEAVNCGIAMQKGFSQSSLDFRIGINLGDIIDDGQDIHGEGVNVAARLEGIADPGGIVISGDVHNQVRNRVVAEYRDMGAQEVKYVSMPVHAFSIQSVGPLTAPIDVSAQVEGFGGRPAIAILPFDNLSGDPEQEFFADGLTEDIITRLSLWRWFPVIARNSTFAFKGTATNITEIGEKLGARYIVEGSVRKAGNRVRVTAQLIEASTGHHVWADKYDRDLDDIFAIQDEITDHIVGALEPAMEDAEQRRTLMKQPDSLDAWEAGLRGFWHFHQASQTENESAIEWFNKSINLDPQFALSHGGLAMAYLAGMMSGWLPSNDETIVKLRLAGQKTIELAPTSARGRLAEGWARILSGQHGPGIEEVERAIEINPSFTPGYHYLGVVLWMAGRPKEAIEAIDRCLRLNPADQAYPRMLGVKSASYIMLGDYVKAVELATIATERAPEFPLAHRNLANALARLGRIEESHSALKEFMRLAPNYLIKALRGRFPWRDDDTFEQFAEGLRKAGLPEG